MRCEVAAHFQEKSAAARLSLPRGCRFGFHPEAIADLDEILEFIAADSVDAADRVIAEIFGFVEDRGVRGHDVSP